jgi:hypothetical protein
MITRTLAALLFVTLGAGIAAQAQSASTINVNVPFEFTFGAQTFPAGSYSVMQPEQHVVILRDARGYTVAQALTQGIESLAPAGSTTLKFRKSGDQHILTEIWQQYQTEGELLRKVDVATSVAKHRSSEARETAEGSRP